TASWHGGQLTVPEFKPGRRSRRWVIAGTALGVLALAALAWLIFAPNSDATTDDDQRMVQGPGDKSKTDSEKGVRRPKDKGSDPILRSNNGKDSFRKKGDDKPRRATVVRKPVVPNDPNVLTVSQKPNDGGKYRTVTAALDKVKPGQTIRVLDNA